MMAFDVKVIIDHLPQILDGFVTTVWCTVWACALGMVLGLIVACGLMSKARIFRYPIRFYVEVIRSTPFLIQLFLLYYGGPSIGIYLDPIQAGIIAAPTTQNYSEQGLMPFPKDNWKSPI